MKSGAMSLKMNLSSFDYAVIDEWRLVDSQPKSW